MKTASSLFHRALCEAHGIAYRHETRFSPTGEMLDRFKAKPDWPTYEREYRALIVERDMAQIWQEVAGRFERPCLMCAEQVAETCHRRLLAETLAGRNPDLVRHL